MLSHKTIIDYLSFTFAPPLLRRLTELAKMGAKLKSPLAGIDWHIAHRELASYIEPLLMPDEFVLDGSLSQLHQCGFELQSSIADPELSAADSAIASRAVSFHGCYSDLIASFGVQWLDSLCKAELDFFLHVLNESVSPSASSPRWTVIPKLGGMFGYKNSASLLCDGMSAGVIAWGSSNHGCLVSFTGTGCAALDFPALHRILAPLGKQAPACDALAADGSKIQKSVTFGAKITRLDIALDDYEGDTFDPHSMYQCAEDGAFVGRGKPPKYSWVESGTCLPADRARAYGRRYTLEPSSGVTFYVGHRESGKLVRFYEKGKQMKSEDYPNWQRAEVEIHSKDRVIPFDALINPDAYFAGAYPVLADILRDVTPILICTFRNNFEINESVAIENGRRQIGRLVNYMSRVARMSPFDIVATFLSGLDPLSIPRRLSVPVPQEYINSFAAEGFYSDIEGAHYV